jgi:hypothetical protein
MAIWEFALRRKQFSQNWFFGFSRPRRQRDKAMTITPGALCVSRGTDHFPAQLSADSFLA